MTHLIHLLAGAFVLDALDESQRNAFADHLADCAECRDEIVGLREAAALLSHVTAHPPPPDLRPRILARIKQIRPLPPVVTRAPLPAAGPAAHREAPSRPTRRLRWASLAAAAAVLGILGAGTTTWWPSDDSPVTSGVSQVLQAPDRKHSTVESDTGWTATVWHSDSVHRAVIVTTDMPDPPDGMVYQVWLDQPSSGLVSAGVMPATPDQSLLLQGDAATANGTRVTLEPEGGSSRPTSDPIADFDFGQGA